MTPPALPEMACAVCLVPLNILNGTYRHPLQHDNDGHEPVAVPVSSLDTVRRVCDFCSDPQPAWAITGSDLALLAGTASNGLMQHFGQRWAACAACTIDIDAGQIHKMAERAAHRSGQDRNPALLQAYRYLHTEFLTTRQPGRTLVTTTAWPDLHLTATDLPRIRDRLTTFYRGPHGLPDTLGNPTVRREAADALDRSRLFFVDDTFTDLVQAAAASLPAITITADLPPGDDGLLVWSHAITSGGTIAASWYRRDDLIEVVLYRSIGTGLADQPLQTLREEIGWLAPFRTQRLEAGRNLDAETSRHIAPLIATWLLIAQGIADTDTTDIDPRTRKRYQRTNRRPPDVRIVHLRATHRTRAPSTPRTGQRTYTSRVWVTGHWRNQPYGPGRTLRRPVYIHPHLRGPADADINLSTTVRVLGRRVADQT